MSTNAWSTASDFGQKSDLCVRIREILRNYPEGLSILKELLQNADDAKARTIKLCVAESRTTPNDPGSDVLDTLLSGPSLLAYNDGVFTATDLKSIQQIGDSLKKSTGNKTGRFGIGFNAIYHLTDLPVFVSTSNLVLFDPQAKYVPGINPSNPGKNIDVLSQQGKQVRSEH